MRLPLTRWLPAQSVRIAGHGLMGLVVCVCACVVACAADVRAESLVENVPIVGGTAALSRALGIDPVPERARFMSELVHVIYDAAEGKSASKDALRAQLGAYLESAARRSSDLTSEAVPLPLPAHIWSDAIFQRPISPDDLFSAVIQDRSAALLCYGLAALDDETLHYLAEQPAVLRRLYERDAAVFAAFGGSLHIRHNAVLVPGGASAVLLWEAALGEPAATPHRFIRELFSRREGRVAYLYDSVTQLDAGRRAFALGLWIAEPERRLNRFTSFLNAIQAFPGWGVPARPFGRPPDDAILMLTRINADDRGVPHAPSRRVFWSQAFDGLDIPQDPARRLANLEKDGTFDAAWMAEAVLNTPTQFRAERLDQVAFGQRAFAGIPDGALADALIAVRAFPRYRMLVLTLERMGVKTTAVYAAAVRHAEQIATLDPARAVIALSQYQGALALLARSARVHGLDVEQAEALVTSLSSLPLTSNGYAGGVARWLRSELMPRLGGGADIDATILQSVAGRVQTKNAEAALVSWEERVYRVDLVEPEARRIARTLQKFKAETVRHALDIEAIASTLLPSDLNVNEIEAATVVLRQLLASVSPATADKPARTDKLSRAVRDLSKITEPAEVQNAIDIARSLVGLADEMLADALRAWAYAIDLGDTSGGRVIAGDISSRHDFGLAGPDNDQRARQPWAEPEQVIQTSVPWHVAGSLLGLDLGLSQTMLRRVSSDGLPRPPRLLSADRDVFARTVSLLKPIELADRDVEAIAHAIGAGRQRVAQLGASAGKLDEVADEIALDGWRRGALRWTLANEPANASSYFSLAELLFLGRPLLTASPDAWGVAAVGLDGCLCTKFPAPGRWSVMVGRSRGGQTSGQIADLNLRVLLALKELRLPAAIAREVLEAATQDYIDSVMPLYPDDWLALVRSAQVISTDRIADYVAALTVDGTLSPVAPAQRAR